MKNVKIKKINQKAKIPTYATENSAGADLYACTDGDIVIGPFETKLIHTGIIMEIPEGYAGLIYARSGMAAKKDLAPANKTGVIDSDYRGEIMIALHNHGKKPRTVCDGERIAQIIITPYERAAFDLSDDLSKTERSDGGFGSTGIR